MRCERLRLRKIRYAESRADWLQRQFGAAHVLARKALSKQEIFRQLPQRNDAPVTPR